MSSALCGPELTPDEQAVVDAVDEAYRGCNINYGIFLEVRPLSSIIVSASRHPPTLFICLGVRLIEARDSKGSVDEFM